MVHVGCGFFHDEDSPWKTALKPKGQPMAGWRIEWGGKWEIQRRNTFFRRFGWGIKSCSKLLPKMEIFSGIFCVFLIWMFWTKNVICSEDRPFYAHFAFSIYKQLWWKRRVLASELCPMGFEQAYLHNFLIWSNNRKCPLIYIICDGPVVERMKFSAALQKLTVEVWDVPRARCCAVSSKMPTSGDGAAPLHCHSRFHQRSPVPAHHWLAQGIHLTVRCPQPT